MIFFILNPQVLKLVRGLLNIATEQGVAAITDHVREVVDWGLPEAWVRFRRALADQAFLRGVVVQGVRKEAIPKGGPGVVVAQLGGDHGGKGNVSVHL